VLFCVVYVKRTVRKRGDKNYTYLSLVEAVRVDGKNTQRELFRLGEVDEHRVRRRLDIRRLVCSIASSHPEPSGSHPLTTNKRVPLDLSCHLRLGRAT
jgi:hypothetical protein